MMMRPPLGPADPETVAFVFVFGGLLAVASFHLFKVAPVLGEELRTPEPLAAFQRVAARVLTPAIDSMRETP